MSYKSFQIAGDKLTASDHAKCLHECGKNVGEMLVCQNPKPVENPPCNNQVHISCLQNLEPSLVPHMSIFYCSKCCASNPKLKEEMMRVMTEARQALAQSQSGKSTQLADDVNKLKSVMKQMEKQLSATTSQLKAQMKVNDDIQKRLEISESECEKVKEKLVQIEKSSEPPEKLLKRSASDTSFVRKEDSPNSDVIFASTSAAMTQAAQINHEAEEQMEKIQQKLNQSSIETKPKSHNSMYRFDSTSWPDYEVQETKANQLSEMSLSLLRSSIAKPKSFDGDVTTWAIFLSEFQRTSSRGHYRAIEDMDRLRELITGEALDMFCTELADPYAEPTKILHRLDEFYGVRGSAVRVSLDRILSLSKIDKQSDKNQLKTLYVNSKSFAHQCRANRKESELTSQAVIYIIESKMHHEHAKAWRLWARENHTDESVDGIIAFLEERIRELNVMPQKTKNSAAVHFTDVTGGHANTNPSTSALPPAGSSKANNEVERNSRDKRSQKRNKRFDKVECFKCKEHHPFWKCPILIRASDAIRLQIVDQLHVCHRCLSSTKHEANNCPNKLMQCRVPDCTAANKHPLLHGHPPDKIKRFTNVQVHQQMNVQIQRSTSHYGMIPGHIVSKNGNLIPVTIMLDSGSGISLSTRSLFMKSGLEQIEEYELSMKWTSDVVHVESNAITYDIPFIPYSKKEPIILKAVTAIEDSSLDLPEQDQDPVKMKEDFPYLKDVPIPAYARQKPQILLGLPHIGLLAHVSCVSGQQVEDPVAVLTKLGWTVYGMQTKGLIYQKINSSVAVGFTCIECTSNDMSNEALVEHFKFFNSIDNMGIAHKEATLMSEDDQIGQTIINNTMRFNDDQKRYEIGLLWRPGITSMPDNYSQALSRLQASENRLKKLEMEQFVNQQFNEQVEAGWLVETTKEELEKFPKRNYVYGFIVFNPNKTPPKPRWVNDTAARFNGVSLNSMLLKGPDNLVPLNQSICAAREAQVAFQADVKSMFNQITLRYEDQFSQLCIWRGCDSSQPPRIYRQTRVIFGPTCSPAAANAVRIAHANNHKEKFPEASDVALHQMYVDDVADSRDTVEEAAKVANQLIEMFDLIGWPLVEFYSNQPEFLKRLPKDRVGKRLIEIGDQDEQFVTKVLGLFWKPHSDVYVFRTNDDKIIKRCSDPNYNATKREVLGTIMRIFDPLGLVIPFRIRGLIIMQHIWRSGTDWKKPVPAEVAEEFKIWLKDFEAVTKLEIPRSYVNVNLKDCELSLHVFVDAGTEAYAACVYLRAVHKDTIFVRLITAKGRVAPLKYMSIPKLELMSGLLGARLLQSVKKWHRRLNIVDYICWTDSVTSYRWIRSPHLPRTPFTAPRISEIQELTSADKWRYVPSKLNVADYGTKQREMDYSDAKHEWFSGPKFLYDSEDKWPKQPATTCPKEEKTRIFHVQTFKSTNIFSAGIISSVSAKVRSDWMTYTRVVARALRFVDRTSHVCPKNRQSGPISSHEFNRAENYIIRGIQMATFPDEYIKLSRGGKIDKNSKLASLSPFFCKQTGLIRATTRLSSNFPLDQRLPPILPNFHETSDAIASYYHEFHDHVNDSSIIGAIRTRVWIISAKRLVRRVRARCVHCINKRAKPSHPTGSSLPDFRLDLSNKPFYYTGCDLFGPYETYIKRSKAKETIYVVIFTCLVTRAVYFEVLNDMSTTCFLAALDKLWARRGPIVHMYSDNGRNFCGAAKALNCQTNSQSISTIVNASESQKMLEGKRITWHFTPPYTPQFGGTWERLIKDTKRSLDASLGKFIVPRTSFEAALARIETNLNNRPLTDLPISPQDQVPLTPYLLIQGYQNYPVLDEGCCPKSILDEGIMKLKTAERINALVQTFRSRFVREYAPVITRSTSKIKKKDGKNNRLKVGDLVIYLDPTLSMAHWPKGVVSRVYPGQDKKVRVVDIRLSDGRILGKRSTYRVAKLDFRLENPEAEQEKYEKGLTVVENSKNSSNSENQNSSMRSVKKSQKLKSEKTCNKMSSINKIIFDDDLAPAATSSESDSHPTLNADEKELYLDPEGRRTVCVDNIPWNLGASEIFQILERFGQVVTIRGTTYDGVRATRCMVTFATEFAAISATNHNESQVIVSSGSAFCLKISFPLKKFKLMDRKLKMNFITLSSRIHQEESRILFITNKGPSRLVDRATMPSISNAYGYVHFCPPEERFTFSQQPINMSNIDAEVEKLPRECKIRVNVGESFQENAEMVDDQNEIELCLSEDPFSDEEDLRETLNARSNTQRVLESQAGTSHSTGSQCSKKGGR